MARRTAVFHERERMQRAVRDLASHGVSRDQILVAPAAPDPHGAPRSWLGLPHRAYYAGIGAAVGMMAGVAFSGAPGGETLTTIWSVVVGALLGALVGSIVGVAIGGARKERWKRRAAEQWAVQVDVPSEDDAARAAEVLAQHGGRMQPA